MQNVASWDALKHELSGKTLVMRILSLFADTQKGPIIKSTLEVEPFWEFGRSHALCIFMRDFYPKPVLIRPHKEGLELLGGACTQHNGLVGV